MPTSSIAQEVNYVDNGSKRGKCDSKSSKTTKMPKWTMNEEIVVSGISGRFPGMSLHYRYNMAIKEIKTLFKPESDNIEEFAHNLYNNIDMVVEDERRWPYGVSQLIVLY